MKKVFLTLIPVLFSVFDNLYAQQIYSLPTIEKVEVSNGILLQIEHSNNFLLRVKFQDIDSTCLVKTVKDRTLILEIENRSACKGKVSINLDCPDLKEIEASGKAEVSTENLLKRDSLKITVKMNAEAYIDMDIKYLFADIYEAGLLTAKGYAVKQDISVSTSSTFSGFDLEGDTVNVKAKLGGKAKICAVEEMNATTASGGYVGYKCDPQKKTVDSEAGGSVEESKE